MNIVVAYICVANGPITEDYAARFAATWHEYPPGYEHDTLIISNGGPPSRSLSLILPELRSKFFIRSNEGWDIQGYIEAARSPCAHYDAMLCLGESNYFHREGWLKRLAEAWEHHGPGFYGPYSSNAVRSHLNTTAFFCPPSLLTNYPRHVSTRQDRYEFEHGEGALWRRAAARGMPAVLVTWDGEWDPYRWRLPRNILWRGDQSNLLMHCNHSDGFFNATPRVKAEWARRADAPFR